MASTLAKFSTVPWRRGDPGLRKMLPSTRFQSEPRTCFRLSFHRESPEGTNVLPSRRLELRAENPQFQPLDPDSSAGLGNTSKSPFGPTAVLLVGFSKDEFRLFSQMMDELGATMVKVLSCTESMLQGSLMEALEKGSTGYTEAVDVQRTVFLSGLYSGEVMEVISAYSETGLPEPVFAAAVPANANAVLRELCDEVLEDHLATKRRNDEV
uniref:Transmembrane protein n=1 Tax=Tetraselmis sp. GSL018 TaxID=582737 RepID=A0A061QZG0_9CHLO|mmetsp:Transcript_10981/g.26061  ORF Transcript_10981/g.26061 Transcript_10981/m.26061 type:complete len:211 (-) Transcript_10981:125-757(-)